MVAFMDVFRCYTELQIAGKSDHQYLEGNFFPGMGRLVDNRSLLLSMGQWVNYYSIRPALNINGSVTVRAVGYY